MRFYTRYFFKHKRPHFIPPGKIDEEFYTEIKDRLKNEPNFTFKSDISFWNSYKTIFIVFLVFLVSLSLAFFLSSYANNFPLIYGISIFILLISAQPGIYFIILIIYLGSYFLKERKFHSDFKKAVFNSVNFKSFLEAFYIGKYVEQFPPKEYTYENDINQLKTFVESKNLASEIALYKYSTKPDIFIVLSTNEDINEFIESQTDWSEINRKDKIRWTIKYQVEIPCIYGNKKLKSRMEL